MTINEKSTIVISNAHLFANLIVQRFDRCIHLCLLELSLPVILALPQQLIPGKGTVAPVVAGTSKSAPHLVEQLPLATMLAYVQCRGLAGVTDADNVCALASRVMHMCECE